MVTNSGEIEVLTNGLTNIGSGNFKLFENDVTIDSDTVLADLDEATFPGYAAVTPVPDGALATNVDGAAEQAYEEAVFTLSGGGTADVYGWYIESDTGVLIAADRFYPSAALTLDSIHPDVRITHIISLQEISEI